MKALATSLYVLCVFLGSSLFAEAPSTIKDSVTGVTFPRQVSFAFGGQDINLQLTGLATRKEGAENLYSVAHYMKAADDVAAYDPVGSILDDSRAKQLTLKWVKTLPTGTVQKNFKVAFDKDLTADDQKKLQPEISQFLSFFDHDVKNGDEYVIRWLPGGFIMAYINNVYIGVIENDAFAKAVWEIWFGKNSVVDRDSLITLMH
ncbi:MAG: chalcone isomerase family protein [Chlamydiales bacterium]|nr:chalcone isomerase family protein [Chlamydiales bacterium]